MKLYLPLKQKIEFDHCVLLNEYQDIFGNLNIQRVKIGERPNTFLTFDIYDSDYCLIRSVSSYDILNEDTWMSIYSDSEPYCYNLHRHYVYK